MTNYFSKQNQVNDMSNSKVNSFGTLYSAITSVMINGLRTSLMLVLSIVFVFQSVFLGGEVLAEPFGFFGQEKATPKQLVKEAANLRSDREDNFNQMTKDLQDGRGDKVVKELTQSAEEAGDRVNKLAKDGGDNVEVNFKKAQDAINNSLEDTKKAIGDRSGEVMDSVKKAISK